MNFRMAILILAFVLSLFVLMSFNSRLNKRLSRTSLIESVKKMPVVPSEFSPLYDTLYLLGDSYIEISLREQVARVICRNDSIYKFRISSGNGYIKEGKETPEGIYTVQSKYREAVSKQFDNAKLFNWIGFNGNIGFHGLEGTNYYRSLGLRPSSHGCVRIATEDGKRMFDLIKVGSPVIVFKDEPARIVKFASLSEFRPNEDILLQSFNRKQNLILTRRLKNLYESRGQQFNQGRIFLDGKTSFRPGGYELGIASKISPRQYYPFKIDKHDHNQIDKLMFRMDFFSKIKDTASVAAK